MSTKVTCGGHIQSESNPNDSSFMHKLMSCETKLAVSSRHTRFGFMTSILYVTDSFRWRGTRPGSGITTRDEKLVCRVIDEYGASQVGFNMAYFHKISKFWSALKHLEPSRQKLYVQIAIDAYNRVFPAWLFEYIFLASLLKHSVWWHFFAIEWHKTHPMAPLSRLQGTVGDNRWHGNQNSNHECWNPGCLLYFSRHHSIAMLSVFDN